jgi:hypothetical protein
VSKTSEKRLERRLEQAEYLWEQAQLKAATIQSALDYAIDQFNKHKDELTPEVIEQTEDMIAQRQKEVKEFLMGEKDLYVKRTGLLK